MKPSLIIIPVVLILAGAGGAFLYLGIGKGSSITDTGIQNFFPDFFDFGSSDKTPDSGGDAIDAPTGDDPDIPDQGIRARLFQITEKPIAGYTIVQSVAGPVIRYLEKEKGTIYEVTLSDNKETRISNKTIVGVQSVVWGTTGNEFITQTLLEGVVSYTFYSFTGDPSLYTFSKDLRKGDEGIDVTNLQKLLNQDPETLVAVRGAGSPGSETLYFGEATRKAVMKFQEKYKDEILTPQGLSSGTGIVDAATRIHLEKIQIQRGEDELALETALASKKLPDAIAALVLSPDGKKIFYLAKNGAGGVSGIVAGIDGRNPKMLFDSPLTGWIPSWPTATIILVTTKSSAYAEGFTYKLSVAGGAPQKVIGGIPGLTVMPDDNLALVLYSKAGENRLKLETNLLDVKKNSGQMLSITTLPEKCAWGNNQKILCAVPRALPPQAYPDDWYKGKVSFNDTFWEIDPVSLAEEMLIDPSTMQSGEIDAIGLSADAGGEYLAFINKKDFTLWALRLR